MLAVSRLLLSVTSRSLGSSDAQIFVVARSLSPHFLDNSGSVDLEVVRKCPDEVLRKSITRALRTSPRIAALPWLPRRQLFWGCIFSYGRFCLANWFVNHKLSNCYCSKDLYRKSKTMPILL